MDPADQSPEEVYSVWALPPEHVRERLRGLMAGLRAAHGGPPFEPHATVVGAVRMRRPAAIDALRAAAASAGVGPYTARVTGVARGDFFYQCVYLLLEPTPEVIQTSDHFCAHFGYERSTPYMPHVSLLYGDLTDEEKEAARKKVEEMDSELSGLQFEISELALYRTDTEDKSLGVLGTGGGMQPCEEVISFLPMILLLQVRDCSCGLVTLRLSFRCLICISSSPFALNKE